MTVSYAAEVAQCTGFGCFPKLLLRWRASIYKLIWLDLLVYLIFYYILNSIYRFHLDNSQKQVFETLVKYCSNSMSLIPLMFVLGFYVSIVVKRWWGQYMTLPWPDSTAVYVSSLIRGQDENGRKMRRTIMRYVCLSLTLVLTMISPRVKKRFPTLDQLIDVGLLVENEKDILKSMNEKFAKYPKHWMPIVWASSIVTRARKEGRIRDDSSIKTLIDSLNTFRGNCMALTFYDTISIPLVYTQVVTIAVYTYFLASILGRQWTGQVDIEGLLNIVNYFPIFTVLEFMFFMGWLKVAESLICPFGEDDDDFELNWMIDRNLQVSYLIVDEMHNEHPDLLKDQYWNGIYPPNVVFKCDQKQPKSDEPPQHSTARMDGPYAKDPFCRVPIMESLTHLFFKFGNRQSTQSQQSVAENLDQINSTLKQFFDPQEVRASQDPEANSSNNVSTEVLKSATADYIKSETSVAHLDTNASDDKFEQLKLERMQERAQKQNFLVVIPAVTDTTTGAEILSCKSSLESLNGSESGPADNTLESKKNVYHFAIEYIISVIEMTITYTAEVATCKRFGCFIKLLARWRGSIYKLVWMDLLLFLFLYYGINLIYIYILNEGSQRTFETVVYYCATYSSLIPLSFVLGFYVNLVMTRWWEQYTTIPWPDSIAVFVSAHVHGQDEGGRVMRRTVMRYVCLCLTIVFTMISPCVKKRFPKIKHLVDAGLLLENEKKIIETMDCAFPKYPKHWMPIIWAASIITRARKEGRIRDDFAVKTIIDELNNFRGRCGTLMYYDFISIPLVYTQVVTIAVYSFFVSSLLAHQWTKLKQDSYETFDFCVPIFITMEFFFYMGWLKVAETLINPFGEDDDDFEVNWMIDRNLQVSYLIVDEMHQEHPELVKDQYWDEVYPNELPYESEARREQPPESSTAKYDVDDSPTLSSVKVCPDVDNVAIEDKPMQNSIMSIRSQRFKEAFQRFSQGSVSDIESIQCITSYGPTMSSMESVIFKLENLTDQRKSVLRLSGEEEIELEREFESDEEDVLVDEAEEEKTATESFCENESDSDPFERLRLERQQERIQRTNAFLQRYFGYNFKIANLPMMPDTNMLDKVKIKMHQHSLAQSIPMASNEANDFDSISRHSHLNESAKIAPTISPIMSTESNLEAIINVIPMSLQDTETRTGQLLDLNSAAPKILTEKSHSMTNLECSIIPSKSYINSNIIDPPSHALQKVAPESPLADPNVSMQMIDAGKTIQISPDASQIMEIPVTSVFDTASLSNIDHTFQADPEIAEFSGVMQSRDVTVSPMASIVSLSTVGSSEADEWEVVASEKSFLQDEERP